MRGAAMIECGGDNNQPPVKAASDWMDHLPGIFLANLSKWLFGLLYARADIGPPVPLVRGDIHTGWCLHKANTSLQNID